MPKQKSRNKTQDSRNWMNLAKSKKKIVRKEQASSNNNNSNNKK